jgi:hypothetical protein
MDMARREMDTMMGGFGMRDPFQSLLATDPFMPDEDITPNVSALELTCAQRKRA